MGQLNGSKTLKNARINTLLYMMRLELAIIVQCTTTGPIDNNVHYVILSIMIYRGYYTAIA